MKQKLLLFAFTLLSTMSFSQSTPTAFEDWKSTDGTQNFFYKNVTKTDGSGNVYVAGATIATGGATDILVVKKNSAGVTLWTKQYNGAANFHDFATGLVVNTSGDVYITGAVTNNTVNLSQDLIVIKYNSTGTQQWVKTYDGGYGSDVGKDLVLDGSNNIYITGGSYNAGGNTDALTIAFNNSGTQLWVNTYDYTGLNDAGVKISVGHGKASVICPVTISTNNYKIATLNYLISTGVPSETVTTSATTTSSVEIVTDMTTDAAGNIYICGATQVSGQGYNYYLAKLTTSLTIAWEQTYNSSSNLNDQAKGIKVDASGNVYVTGYSTSSTQGKNITTIKYNSSGTQQWIQNINSNTNGDDEAADMEIDNSSNIYVAGTISGNINKLDYYTIKYNSSGTKLWDMQSDGSHLNDQATNLAMDSLSNVIVTGQSETAPNTYVYTTVKYVQFDIVPFTDLNNEPINPKSLYLPNKGQLLNTSLTNETDILYYNLNNYPESYIARNRLSFLQFHRDTLVSTTDSIERMDMVLTNCNTKGKIYKEDAGTTHNYNFFVGNITVPDIHGYNKIIAPEIYTGIDLHYYSNAYGIKAYFVLKPNADPKQISILLQGQQSATITSNNLKINGLLGSINLRQPNVYNINGGTNVPITGTGWAISAGIVSINAGSYNTSQPLVIEFSNTSANTFAQLSTASASDNLDWCTYVGNTANDGFNRIATDKSNNKYMGGTTDGNNYPTTAGVFSGNNIGGTVVLLTKFNHLNKMLHSTYYGGSASSSPNNVYNGLRGIAVDSLQNIFFVGNTTTSNFPFPVTQPSGSYHYTTNLANSGANYGTSYVIKLDSTMGTNLWGTHIGNTSVALLNDVMVDKNQNVTVVGYCNSSGTTFNFPTPPSGAYYNTQGLGFLFRFSNNGVAQYATRTANWISRIAENKANGDYFITSKLYSGDVGQKFKNPGGGAYFDNSVYLWDFYVARFNNQDSITWATVFGGVHNETITDMALKDSMLILVGTADGIGFPIKYAPGQYVDSVHTNWAATDNDVAFVRFNSYTGKHIYSSYYGGEELSFSQGIDRDDYPTACIIDDYGHYYISGNTSSDPASSFILQQASGFYYSGTYYGNNSGFLLCYTANNDKILSTYLGGRTYEPTDGLGGDNTYMSDMGISSSGKLFIAGKTDANRYFPIYDASGGVAYMDTVLSSPVNAFPLYYTDGFIASFNNLAFVGIHDLDKNQIFGGVLVYPNPSLGIYNIEMEGLILNKTINFNIYNTLGQMVYKEDVKSHDGFISKQINLSSLSEGIYFINIIQNNKSLTVKVVKQ